LKKSVLIKVILFLIVISGYAALTFHWDASRPFRGEDHFIESMGAIFLFSASIMFFVSYLLSSRNEKKTDKLHPKKNFFYIFLALLFFIGGGEEISWGQRIFEWEAPEFFQKNNRQRETNLHNIRLLNDQRFRRGQKRENDRRPISSILLDIDVWFVSFWVSYCLILPILNRYSLRSREYAARFGVPVPPLWIGLLLLVNFSFYAIPHYLSLLGRMDHGFNELKESYDGFIFAVLAHLELRKQLNCENTS
jgi:hypothetical protein